MEKSSVRLSIVDYTTTNQLVDPLNQFLRQQDFPPGCSLVAIARLKLETGRLLLSMLEYNCK